MNAGKEVETPVRKPPTPGRVAGVQEEVGGLSWSRAQGPRVDDRCEIWREPMSVAAQRWGPSKPRFRTSSCQELGEQLTPPRSSEDRVDEGATVTARPVFPGADLRIWICSYSPASFQEYPSHQGMGGRK